MIVAMAGAVDVSPSGSFARQLFHRARHLRRHALHRTGAPPARCRPLSDPVGFSFGFIAAAGRTLLLAHSRHQPDHQCRPAGAQAAAGAMPMTHCRPSTSSCRPTTRTNTSWRRRIAAAQGDGLSARQAERLAARRRRHRPEVQRHRSARKPQPRVARRLALQNAVRRARRAAT